MKNDASKWDQRRKKENKIMTKTLRFARRYHRNKYAMKIFHADEVWETVEMTSLALICAPFFVAFNLHFNEVPTLCAHKMFNMLSTVMFIYPKKKLGGGGRVWNERKIRVPYNSGALMVLNKRFYKVDVIANLNDKTENVFVESCLFFFCSYNKYKHMYAVRTNIMFSARCALCAARDTRCTPN